VRLKRISEVGKGTARLLPARLAAFLLAVLVAFALSSFGTGHAHAESAGSAPAALERAVTASGNAQAAQAHMHPVPCDEDQGGQGSCCMSMSACGFCAPVPLAGFASLPMGTPLVSVPVSVLLPRDPPTLRRPPKLFVTA